MKQTLTKRQHELLTLLQADRDGSMPSVRELATQLGARSPNSVVVLLRALEQKGFISRSPRQARGIRVEVPADEIAPVGVTLPIVGPARAEAPLEMFTRLRGALQVDERWVAPEGSIVLPMPDDGMDRAGILKGDLLVVAHTRQAIDGALTAVLIGDQWVVRILRLLNDRYHLAPANRTYETLTRPISDPEFYLVGPVRLLLRSLTAGRQS